MASHYRENRAPPVNLSELTGGVSLLFLPIQRWHSKRKRGYVLDILLMPWRCAVCTLIAHGSHGFHLLDHLAAHGAGLTAGQVAVVTLLQVDAHFP